MSNAYSVYKCKIISATPLLMHNGALADPLNPIVKEMKKLTSKRGNKTDADLEELSRLEWYGSLYFHNGSPCLPAEMIEGCLTGAAKKKRKGEHAKTGIIVQENATLDYEGSRDPDEMWKSGVFTHKVGVKVQRNRIIRTRPIFKNWSADLVVHYLPSVLNKSDIQEFMDIAGQLVGLGDWRPKFGRFVVEAS